jgi:hypothetical protein
MAHRPQSHARDTGPVRENKKTGPSVRCAACRGPEQFDNLIITRRRSPRQEPIEKFRTCRDRAAGFSFPLDRRQPDHERDRRVAMVRFAALRPPARRYTREDIQRNHAAKQEKYVAIRLDAGNGMSGRAIERKHHVGRRTIIKALASAAPPPRKRIHREPDAWTAGTATSTRCSERTLRSPPWRSGSASPTTTAPPSPTQLSAPTSPPSGRPWKHLWGARSLPSL